MNNTDRKQKLREIMIIAADLASDNLRTHGDFNRTKERAMIKNVLSTTLALFEYYNKEVQS